MKKLIISSNLISKVLWFITGFFALSMIGSWLFSKIGIPYFPELYFLPLLFYNKKIKRAKTIVLSPRACLILFIELLSIVIGTIRTSGDFYNVFTCARPILYITIISYYFSREKTASISLDSIYFACLGAQIGEFFGKFLSGSASALNSIDHINWLTMCMLFYIPTVKKNHKLTAVSVVIGLINAVLSFYRRIMTFYVIGIIIVILYNTVKRKSWKRIMYVIPITGAVYFVLTRLDWLMMKITSFLNIDYSLFEERFIKKFDAFFHNEVTVSDQVRYDTYDNIINDFWKNVIPNGPIGKSVGIDTYFGMYTDTPLTFLIDVFGSIFSIALLIILIVCAVRCLVFSFIHDDLDDTFVVCALMSPLLIISLFIDGAFLVHLNYAFVTGYCLSGYFYSKKKMRKENNGND